MKQPFDFGKVFHELMSTSAMMENKTPISVILVKTKIESQGGVFVKFDGIDVFFKIPKGSKSDNLDFLRAQRDELKKHGFTLKIQKI